MQVRAFSFAKGGLLAAATLHRQLLASVLAAPCSFFDSTPSGDLVIGTTVQLVCIAASH